MMEAGVPGIRSRVAVIRPPLTAPTYIETSRIRAFAPVMEKVSGSVSAISIAPVRPGMAPTTIPRLVPSAISANGTGEKSCCRASITALQGRSMVKISVNTNWLPRPMTSANAASRMRRPRSTGFREAADASPLLSARSRADPKAKMKSAVAAE